VEELEEEQEEQEEHGEEQGEEQGEAGGTDGLREAAPATFAGGPPAKRPRTDGGQAPKKALARSHARRRHRRDAAIERGGQIPRKKTIEEVVRPASTLPTELATEALPTSSCSYRAKGGGFDGTGRVYSLRTLLEIGFQLIPWDGL
jgi:hypothetical protein